MRERERLFCLSFPHIYGWGRVGNCLIFSDTFTLSHIAQRSQNLAREDDWLFGYDMAIAEIATHDAALNWS